VSEGEGLVGVYWINSGVHSDWRGGAIVAWRGMHCDDTHLYFGGIQAVPPSHIYD